MLGRRAIGATSFAVERVVLKHLQAQLASLSDKDALAVEAISDIMAEEAEHRDRYSDAQARDRIWRAWPVPVVAVATESVIWLGMRLRRPRCLGRMSV
jgi:ubiquinone biosynthesis monooxygenase Coq7